MLTTSSARRKEIYLFDEKPPLLQWSGWCSGLGTIHRRCFSIFTLFCSNVTPPGGAGEESWLGRFSKFCFVPDVRIFFLYQKSEPLFVRCWNLFYFRCSNLFYQMSEPVGGAHNPPMPVGRGGSPLITIITSPIYCGWQTNVRP